MHWATRTHTKRSTSAKCLLKWRTICIQINQERWHTLQIVYVLWLITATLFVIPYLVRAGRFMPGTVISHYLIALIGMALSLPLLAWVSGLTRKKSRWRAFWSAVLGVFVTSSCLATIDISVFDWIGDRFGEDFGPPEDYWGRWWMNFAIFYSQMALVATVFWTLESLSLSRRRALELERSKTAAANAQNAAIEARLSALRYQLNPHFLFNTLNSISSLIVTNRNRDAEAMLERVSDFLRVTISSAPEEQETLECEIEAVESYLAIESIRFGDRMKMEIVCPPSLILASFPTFLLQPLVENAVKYGVAASDREVTIRIVAYRDDDQLIVSVEDNGTAVHSTSHGTGIGLRNVSERLVTLYGPDARLDALRTSDGFIAKVTLPLVFPDSE